MSLNAPDWAVRPPTPAWTPTGEVTTAVTALRGAWRYMALVIILACTTTGLAGRTATAQWVSVRAYAPAGCTLAERPPAPLCVNATVTLSVASLRVCRAGGVCSVHSYLAIEDVVSLDYSTPLAPILQFIVEIEFAQAMGVFAMFFFIFAVISSAISIRALSLSCDTGHEAPHCGCCGTTKTILAFLSTAFVLLFFSIVVAVDFLVTPRPLLPPSDNGSDDGYGGADDLQLSSSSSALLSDRRAVSPEYSYDIEGGSYATAAMLLCLATLGCIVMTKVRAEVLV